MPGKVKGRRLLISLRPEDERAIQRAAKLDSLPVATFIRRAAVLAARERLVGASAGGGRP